MTAQDLNLSRKDSAVNVTDDREARPKFWIAAYTRPRSEKKVASELSKLDIETYVPVQKQLRIWSDRKKYVEVPVIPMVLFAKVNEPEIKRISLHPLILKILTYPGEKHAAAIPEAEIERLRQVLNQSELPVDFEFGNIKSNDFVMITSGKLKGVAGMVKESNKENSTIWISVNLLGGAVIKISNSKIERITSGASNPTSI